MPAHSICISSRQIRRRASASRGRSAGIGASGAATGGGAFSDAAAGGEAGAPPAIAATALLHGAESCAALRWRHWNALVPPGCTPEQCDTKSERQAARIALRCCVVGGWAVFAAVAAGDEGEGLARVGSDLFVRDAGCSRRAGSADDGAAVVLDGDATALRQAGESPAALAFRQSTTSGLLGEIQEQCAMKSSSVQARLIALI
ncbi:MAG: hypothetical protein WB563_16385 [Pseudolabrys sp.]